MKKNAKELLARVVILLIGLTIAHLGVTLFLLANLLHQKRIANLHHNDFVELNLDNKKVIMTMVNH